MGRQGGLPSARSRPSAVEPVADDLVTIVWIPYKIVEGGRRPASKTIEIWPENARSRDPGVVCLLLPVPVHDVGHHSGTSL